MSKEKNYKTSKKVLIKRKMSILKMLVFTKNLQQSETNKCLITERKLGQTKKYNLNSSILKMVMKMKKMFKEQSKLAKDR